MPNTVSDKEATPTGPRAALVLLLRFTQRRSGWVIFCVAITTLVAGWAAVRVGVNPSLDSILTSVSETSALLVEYGQSRAESDWIVVLAEGPGLFEPATLGALGAAINRIASRPEVVGVLDPFRFITYASEGGRVRSELLAPDGAASLDTPAAAAAFRARLLAEPLARNLVVTAAGDALGMLFNAPGLPRHAALLEAIDAAFLPLEEQGMRVSVAGLATIREETRGRLIRDLPILLAVALLVIVATYYAWFRSFAIALLPMAGAVVATVWTTAVMALFGLDFTILTVMTPALVSTLGSAYSVHIISAYLVERPGAGAPSAYAGVPATVVLTALTTMAGFTSLVTGSVAAVRHFGLITAVGIALSVVLSVTLLPALLARLTLPAPRSGGASQRGLDSLAAWVLRRRGPVVVAGLAATALLLIVALQLGYETDFTRFYRYDDSIMEENAHVQQRLSGFSTVTVTLTAPADAPGGYFLDANVLAQVAAFEARVRQMDSVSWSYSFVGELERVGRAMTGRAEIPRSRGAILLLARLLGAAADAPERAMAPPLIESDGSRLHISVRVIDPVEATFLRGNRLREFLAAVAAVATAQLPLELDVRIWSGATEVLRVEDLLVRDHLLSLLASLVTVLVIGALGFRSLRLGAASVLPMLLAVMIVLAILAATQTKLDVFTMMFSSAAFGVGVDYALHVIARFRRELRSEPTQRAVVRTLAATGRPILVNSVSLLLGLFAFVFSSLTPVFRLGLFIAASVAVASVASLVLLPALLSYRRA